MAETYAASGNFVSTNLLEGAGVKSIDKFGYNVSSLPANTTLQVQFSQDAISWKNSSGTVDGWDTLAAGNHLAEGDALSLSALGWAGGNFYYKIQFDTTDPSATPVLDETVIHYSGRRLFIHSSG